MMNFNDLFENLKELEATAIAFRDRQPVYYDSHWGPSSYTFRATEYQQFSEKKIMSRNNGIICWIDNDTMFVIPGGLGNAEDILSEAGYRWSLDGNGLGNNYYVPLSNGQFFNPYEQVELKEKWELLKAVARASMSRI